MKYNLDYFTHKFDFMPDKLDTVCLGTTQGHFAIDFSHRDDAANLCMNVFLLNMYLPILKKYGKRFLQHTIVIMTMEYPLFMCKTDTQRRDEVSWQYAKVLFGMDPMVSVWKQMLLRLFPYHFVRQPLHRGMIRNFRENEYTNHKPEDEIEFYANFVITNGWEKETGFSRIHDYEHGILTEKEYACMKANRIYLQSAIDYCKKNKWQPILVGLPYSRQFNDILSDSFKEDVFYFNIKKVQEETGVPFFDYSCDKEFSDINHYIDFWFMNKMGSTKFTQRLLRDIKNLRRID